MNRNRIHHTRPGDLTPEERREDERIARELAENDFLLRDLFLPGKTAKNFDLIREKRVRQ